MSGRARLPSGEPRKASQRRTRRATQPQLPSSRAGAWATRYTGWATPERSCARRSAIMPRCRSALWGAVPLSMDDLAAELPAHRRLASGHDPCETAASPIVRACYTHYSFMIYGMQEFPLLRGCAPIRYDFRDNLSIASATLSQVWAKCWLCRFCSAISARTRAIRAAASPNCSIMLSASRSM
jgi:hypothetical protein